MTPIEHQAEFFAKNNEEKIKCARDLIAKVAVAMQNAIQSTELVKDSGAHGIDCGDDQRQLRFHQLRPKPGRRVVFSAAQRDLLGFH
jgi:hypothetical protein